MDNQATKRLTEREIELIKDYFDEQINNDGFVMEYIIRLKEIKEYTIKAVNCHDELVEALKLAKFILTTTDDDRSYRAIKDIEQALSKAGEL